MVINSLEFSGFYKNKKVLVTGHTGFKGSWLSLWLSELGADVIGYALEPKTKNDNFNVSKLKNRITDIRGDIRDIDSLKKVFTVYNPEIVFHLAAQALVLDSYKCPKETYDVNVGGTVNILECCRESDSVKAVLNITSDKCYENKEWMRGYKETDPMGGFDPYSSSKGCSELITTAYRNSFFMDAEKALSSARAGNIVGGGDWSNNRILPDCMKAIFSSKKIEIRNPHAVRPWQHVLDPLRGYLMLTCKMAENIQEYTGAWNFGPGNNSEITVEKVVEKIINYLGKGEWVYTGDKKQHNETKLLTLDISKAKNKLGWEPVLNFEQTVQFTIDWYDKFYMSYDITEFNVSQIKEFVKLANEGKRKKN